MSSGIKNPGVLVGVDGSASSTMAVRWAAREITSQCPTHPRARRTPTHAILDILGLAPALVLLSYADGRKTKLEGSSPMPSGGRGQRPEVRPEINTELLYSAPVPTLIDLSKDAQMVVVGSRGQGLLESVSNALIHHVHCPSR